MESAGTLRVVVAPDGSGDFARGQQALDHVPPYGNKRLVIEIRPGIYKERVTVLADRRRVTFLGSDAAKTVITFNMCATEAGGTFFSSTVDIEDAEFEAANITFEKLLRGIFANLGSGDAVFLEQLLVFF